MSVVWKGCTGMGACLYEDYKNVRYSSGRKIGYFRQQIFYGFWNMVSSIDAPGGNASPNHLFFSQNIMVPDSVKNKCIAGSFKNNPDVHIHIGFPKWSTFDPMHL